MHQRQKRILDMLQRGPLAIKAAAAELQVSEMTVRRDLRDLAEQKLIMPVKGGAVLNPARYEPDTPEPEFLDRKIAIADELFWRVSAAETIFIGTGTTTLVFARLLARRRTSPLTVITNSLPVASTLFSSHCKVILLGGELRLNTLTLVGPIAEKNLEEYRVNWLISGCDSASADYGFYTSDVSLSNLEKKSIRIAEYTAIITDSTKFDRRALTRFAAPEEVDLLITDDALKSEDAAKLTRAGVEVALVSTAGK